MACPHSFTIREISPADLSLVNRWITDEGWNPGIDDLSCIHQMDPHGFFIGELHGEPIGCISAVAYDETSGFIGTYIVKPELRGRGYGIRLWKRAVEYMGTRTIGLDGVLEQQANYRRSGLHPVWKDVRYEGTGAPYRSERVIDLAHVPFKDLEAYDQVIFSAPRSRFLRCWIRRPGSSYGFLENGTLAGYGVLHPCSRGFKIAPLFADNERIARELFRALAGKAPGEIIFLDTPDINRAAVSMAESHGMRNSFEAARMYTGNVVTARYQNVYGITLFELG